MTIEKQRLEKEIEGLVAELEFAIRMMVAENNKIIKLKARIAQLKGTPYSDGKSPIPY